jgi:hypothetical protein
MSKVLSKIRVKKTAKKGKGVFANKDINKGEIILRRKGKVVHVDSIEDVPKQIQDHWFPVGKNEYLISEPPAKYLNHSCNPNAGIKNNKDLVAMRDIKKDDEIVYDYSMVGIDEWTMECHCGAKNCRGVIGKYKDLDRSTKLRYSKYVPKWVKEFR